MCIGIGVLVLQTTEGLKIYAKAGESSHDTLLHEFVPVEEHNNVLKLEYIFPNLLRVDCPDDECKNRFVELGLVEIQFGVLILKSDIEEQVRKSILPRLFTIKTLQNADLSRANLSRANLSRANLSGADLSRANLSEADLSGADLLGANLFGANLSGADLSRANLSEEQLEYTRPRGAIIL